MWNSYKWNINFKFNPGIHLEDPKISKNSTYLVHQYTLEFPIDSSNTKQVMALPNYSYKSFFFFFFEKELMNFINVNELHPTVKTEQYGLEHPLSKLGNLVCVKHIWPDYELHYCHFS